MDRLFHCALGPAQPLSPNEEPVADCGGGGGGQLEEGDLCEVCCAGDQAGSPHPDLSRVVLPFQWNKEKNSKFHGKSEEGKVEREKEN